MFSKEEAKALKVEFWTAFGKIMSKHESASFLKVKWVGYKSFIKDIHFRLETDNKTAKFCIDIQCEDKSIRSIFFEQFSEFKNLLESNFHTEMYWVKSHYLPIGIEVSRIYTQIENVNHFRKSDWPIIFENMEKWLLALDEFWSEFKDIFHELAE